MTLAQGWGLNMANQGIESLATGLANSLNGYLGLQNQQKATMANEDYKNNLEEQRQSALETQKSADALKNKNSEEAYKLTLDGKFDPKMASKEHPELAQKAQDFYDANGRYATVKEGKEMGWFEQADTDKLNKQQDMLEKQAIDRITQQRGNQSTLRTELQRDASGMAYDTIVKAQSEGRPLTQLEQGDLVGQLAKARFGKFTDEDRKAMEDMTAKRGFNHVITYLTGNPGLIGASTDETINNLKQFTKATGLKADEQNNGYMQGVMVQPTGLSNDRWDNVKRFHRGISFADQMATSDKTYQSKKATPSGWSIKKI